MTDDTKATALSLMKARLNRTASDTALDGYFSQRLEAAVLELAGNGIRLTDGADDLMLLVDFAVWRYQNRDSAEDMPKWLRLARRERWLHQHAIDSAAAGNGTDGSETDTGTDAGAGADSGTETDPGGEGNDP